MHGRIRLSLLMFSKHPPVLTCFKYSHCIELKGSLCSIPSFRRKFSTRVKFTNIAIDLSEVFTVIFIIIFGGK